MDTYTKIDNRTMVRDRPVVLSATYDLAGLRRQRASIIASRDAELAEVNALIAQAQALGLVDAPAVVIEDIASPPARP